jgi:hypothetical protein
MIQVRRFILRDRLAAADAQTASPVATTRASAFSRFWWTVP